MIPEVRGEKRYITIIFSDFTKLYSVITRDLNSRSYNSKVEGLNLITFLLSMF